MKFYTYIYGRTLNIDFRELVTTPDSISERSKKLVRQLINTDIQSNGSINRLRYLFVREEKQVVFGVGINHRQFLEDNYKSDKGGRNLRSFIGIVINIDEFNSLNALPTQVEFFLSLYRKYIADVWELEDRPKNREVIISELSESIIDTSWTKLDGTLKFNANENKSWLFAHTDEDMVLRSLKHCLSAVMVGLNNTGHVTTAAKRFNVLIPNAICLDVKANNEIVLRHEVHKNIDAIKDLPKPKKAYGPILIIGGILIITMLTIGLKKCQTTQQTHHNSSDSGDTTTVEISK